MRVAKFVESYFDAWNHWDAQGVADHLADNGIYCDIRDNRQRSQDELVTYLNSFFVMNRHRYELIGDILANGNMVAFQYKTVHLDSIDIREAGDSYRGAEFMTMHGDAALTIADYYESQSSDRNSNIADVSKLQQADSKYAKSGLGSEQLQEYKQRLELLMHTKQTYLQSDLTLPKLAAMVGCSVNHLSQVINAGFGMSFFDYISSYRIAYAKKLLCRCDHHSGAILNIAFTVGFNSNSAFYAAFKKSVGQTPAQYRRAQLASTH